MVLCLQSTSGLVLIVLSKPAADTTDTSATESPSIPGLVGCKYEYERETLITSRKCAQRNE